MQRRKFLKTAGVGAAAATTVAAPALAQGMPELKWRLTSSFPKSLDTLFGGAELFCRRVSELTDGKFKITPFAAGEIVPGFQVLDAVQNGTVEIGQTAAYYYIGKDPTFAFDTAVPFGLNSRQHMAWWMHGGGREADGRVLQGLRRRRSHDGRHRRADGRLVPQGDQDRRRPQGPEVPRRRLRRPDPGQARRGAAADRRRRDLSGAGEGHDRRRRMGRPLRRREARLQQGGAVLLLPRLVGRHRHGHGLHQPEVVGRAAAGLPEGDRDARPTRSRCGCWRKYDNGNPAALRRLVAAGVKLQPFPTAVLEACFNATNEVCNEIVAKNAKFKKVWDIWKPYRSEQVLWSRIAEGGFDGFMARMYGAGKV